MDKSGLFDDDFKLARREESKAHNEMDYYERIANGQQEQMDALLAHKEECMTGIARAKETGLPPIHVREFELLMAHIDLTVETLSFKVEKSLSDFTNAKKIWLQKNKAFNELKEKIKQTITEMEQSTTDPKTDSAGINNDGRDVYADRAIKSASKWR